jgi:transposase
VSEVARLHDISPQHLFAWRKAARAGSLSLPADEAPMLVPRDGASPRWNDGGSIRAGATTPRRSRSRSGPRWFVRHPMSAPAWPWDVLRAVKLLVATKPVDLRRGADGLAALLQHDPLSGNDFYLPLEADRLQILPGTGPGWCRCGSARAWCVPWPPISDGMMRLPAPMLLKLRRLWKTHKNPRWLFPTRAATNPVGRSDAAVFIEFVRRLITGASRAIFLIVDQGPAHIAEKIQAFCLEPERQVAAILSSTLLARPQSR